MTSHGLRLVAVVILTISCIALPAGSYDGATTYSARVLNTSQEECPSDAQRETVINEVKEDIRNSLLQIHSREYMRIILCCIYTYIGSGSHARRTHVILLSLLLSLRPALPSLAAFPYTRILPLILLLVLRTRNIFPVASYYGDN